MSDETSDNERRRFLCVLGAACGATAVAATPGCGGSGDDPPPPFSAGRVADHPQGLWKLYSANAVIVARDAGGYYAFTAICTHQGYNLAFRDPETNCMTTAGCSATSSTGRLVCSSGHGGNFDGNGARTAGPPPSDLAHFQVTVNAGMITVNPGVAVAASVRSSAG